MRTAILEGLSTIRPEAQRQVVRQAIVECRDQLPDKPAQALLARLTSRGSEPDATIAERLGMQLNTFLQNFTRARRFLAECLKKRNIDIEAELS